MDMRFLLTMIALLGGVWIYLLTYIIERSTSEPAYGSLIALGYAHSVIFLYLLLAMATLYEKGLSLVEDNTTDPPTTRLQTLLLLTWPWSLILAVSQYAMVRLGLNIYWLVGGLLLITCLSLAVFFKVRKQMSQLVDRFKNVVQDSIWMFFASLILFLPYMMVCSLVFADIALIHDKELYSSSDNILISASRSGYIFLPNLESIECGLFRANPSDMMSVEITPEERGRGIVYLSATCRTQIIPFEIRRYQRLRVAEPPEMP